MLASPISSFLVNVPLDFTSGVSAGIGSTSHVERGDSLLQL
jgi:hypothetical protein